MRQMNEKVINIGTFPYNYQPFKFQLYLLEIELSLTTNGILEVSLLLNIQFHRKNYKQFNEFIKVD